MGAHVGKCFEQRYKTLLCRLLFGELAKGSYRSVDVGANIDQLAETKSRNTSVLDCLVKYIEQKNPEILFFYEELSHLDAATRCTYSQYLFVLLPSIH